LIVTFIAMVSSNHGRGRRSTTPSGSTGVVTEITNRMIPHLTNGGYDGGTFFLVPFFFVSFDGGAVAL
jgi:hypothetical protein